ncbi:hypothetical protein G5B30_07165 [Sphingobacterium sp. SGG-5]|uniref:hypothetical protein n=1 Tax=Sphingobacterium sp. SGG-5 TaxID=2710881 RepID=UPI0013ED094E|nr:hypothetical protein [Sphingobacterium sp. SGG-5]NGM61695.1 hypothetical protein [Sphingobacterium sp. SGG-5]
MENLKKEKEKKGESGTPPKNTEPNTKVESNTGKRPEKDTNPLPPNPNKVDNHENDE